ncbi:MAG: AAA family ATPase [Candidatus Thiodiazotropha sp. (ex Dulcina madagascariensis)]|nr:AAA family ATPase [Candidatus Thiodiazotropha sp. (ex Dulcina madagascariensis)]
MSDAYEYFSTVELSARLDLIRHLIENSELVPLVRGPSGIGKTLLASRLQQLAPESWSVYNFSADPTMQPERLLAYLARCCGLPDIAGDLLQRLVDRFEVLRRRGRTPVLLVDDAQMLPPTSLITLLRLFERQMDGARLVSIVLFADEQIDLLLATPQLQVMSPQTIQAIDLPAMTRHEASLFMSYLLKNEGLSEKLALDETRLSRIYKETNGNPGLLATAILNAVGQDGPRQGSLLSHYRMQWLVGGIPLLLLILLLLVFQDSINSLFETEEDAVTDRSGERLVESSSEVIALDSSAERQTDLRGEPSPRQTMTEQEMEPPEAVVAPSLEPFPVDPPLPERDAATGMQPVQGPEQDAGSASEVGEVILPAKITGRVDESIQIESLPLAEDESAVIADGEGPEIEDSSSPVSQAGVGPEQESTPEKPPADEGALTEQAPVPTAVVSEEVVVASSTVKVDSTGRESDWVLSQPQDRYTLQLIAVENIESLQSFIEENGLKDEVHTFKTERKGAPWYALLWGDFPDQASAQQAIGSLPPAVRKGGVWARSFASLQQAVAQ